MSQKQGKIAKFIGKSKVISNTRTAIRKQERKLGRKLSKEEEKEICKKQLRKSATKFAIPVLIGAIGIGAFANRDKILELPEAKGERIEQEVKETPQESFRDKYKVAEKDLVKTETEMEKLEKELNALEGKDDILKFVKNMYIDEYEKIYGETDLTTEDLTILANYQDYIYQDKEAGESITHGKTPYITEEQLKKDNRKIDIAYDVKTYKVIAKDNKVLDYFSSDFGSIIPGDSYNEMKNEEFGIPAMRECIEKTIDYVENSENEQYKEDFKQAVKEYKEKQENQEKQVAEVKDEMEIED